MSTPTTPVNDEVTMYVVVRNDLKLTKGKLVAQTGHAVHLALRTEDPHPSHRTHWENGSYAKIALKVESEEALDQLAKALREAGIPHAVVTDEGRTEIPPNTKTALGIAPRPRSHLQPFVGHLKLL